MTASTKPMALRPWLWAAVALTLLKLWLTRGQPVYAIGQASHDDRLFIELTGHLLNGEWLGAYNQLTLAKGPFFSLFMAASFWLGLPLGLTQQLAYAGASAVLVFALRPWLRNGWVKLLVYALLLWNPMSFEGANLGRLLRQNVATPLALLVFAGLIALYARRQTGFRRQGPWAALTGLAFGCFWLTREEAVWLLPGVGLLGLAYVWDLAGDWRERKSAATRTAGVLLLAAALPVGTVSALNAYYYGWFGTVEFRATEFKDAYGALLRVQAGPAIPYVPITRQMRDAIYPLSPAFAELKPFFDGEIGLHWADQEIFSAAERQIRAGWIMWALRDTVAAAGHANSAGDALAFYQRMANEINAACDLGQLRARPRRSGFLPPITPEFIQRIRPAGLRFARNFAFFESFTARMPGSGGDYQDLKIFRDLTRDRLSPASRSPEPPVPEQDRLNQWKVEVLENVGQRLAFLLSWIVPLAHVIGLVRLIDSICERQVSFPLVLAGAAWLACLADLAINVLVHITSFDNMTPAAMASAYPLLLVFVVGVGIDSGTAWTQRPRSIRLWPWGVVAPSAVLLMAMLPGWMTVRDLRINAPSSAVAGSAVQVSFLANTEAGQSERIGFLHAESSSDGGLTWTPLCYERNLGPAVTRAYAVTVGAAGTTLQLRVRAAFRGGVAGDVDYTGAAIRWKDTWENWGQPPARIATVVVK